ncbi:hypothetical protein DFH07DRAFT_833120 [Mycena maculata]|uniref:Uncharacterized protein n=1 Tax=Mycena maculata TaxID=230809 RepID=A0AAD7IPE1_9AGAR|nr:hypothetical protein DFH07DRAFT_833120 [Mycena maculata]
MASRPTWPLYDTVSTTLSVSALLAPNSASAAPSRASRSANCATMVGGSLYGFAAARPPRGRFGAAGRWAAAKSAASSRSRTASRGPRCSRLRERRSEYLVRGRRGDLPVDVVVVVRIHAYELRVPDWEEVRRAQLVKVFRDVLERPITTNEDTRDITVRIPQGIEFAPGLLLVEELEEAEEREAGGRALEKPMARTSTRSLWKDIVGG